MRFTWSQVICALLVVGRTQALRSEELSSEIKADVKNTSNQYSPVELNSKIKNELKGNNFSFLPPIFLFEYTNNTNATNDDKSKRTIDETLGYGLQRNNIIFGHYNYYFPDGKSGTPVSVEESISPFTPNNIVKTGFNPEIHNQYGGEKKEIKFFNQESKNAEIEKLPNLDNTHGFSDQKTKLQQTSSSLRSPQETSTRSTTHLFPLITANPAPFTFSSFSTTPLSIFESTTKSIQVNNAQVENSSPESLSDITPAAYRAKYRFGPYNTVKTAVYDSGDSNPQENFYSPPDDDLNNYPKYSVENGVKYEHKIVWKYPDGRVSNTPPTSYVTYLKSSTPKTITSSNPQSIRYKNKPTNLQTIPQVYNTDQSIYSQGSAQLPKEDSRFKNSNEFSPADLLDSSYDSESVKSPSTFHKIVYQNSFNMKPSTRYHLSSNSGHRGNQRISYNSAKTVRPVSKYAVNSPNPEYIGTTESPEKIDLKKFLSEGHNYFNRMRTTLNFPKNSYGQKIVDPQYNDLLKYNPSIMQYIGNPSSILNAQPTFVQAGNSLIPVIILRVDGIPPVQQKSTPNINLKALLQQYLTHYAQSLKEMSQDSSYDLGSEYNLRSHISKESNPISDLTELTQSLSQYSNNPDIISDSKNKFYQRNRYDRRHYQSSNYVPIVKQGQRYIEDETKMIETVNRYTSQGKKPQKVKNVEIIDNPSYTTYHRS